MALKNFSAVVFGVWALLCLSVMLSAQDKHLPIYSVETDQKLVALGINSAWGNEDIQDILTALETAGVRASFFVLGEFADDFPQSVELIAQAGHEVGSHSNTHADMNTLSEGKILEQIRESVRKIEGLTSQPVTLFRPPSGAYDNRVIRLIEQEGLYPIQWNADSLDYRGYTARQMLDRISRTLEPGSILLFHSGTKNTAAALPEVIAGIRAEGYEFVTVGELIHPRPYTVDFRGRQYPAD